MIISKERKKRVISKWRERKRESEGGKRERQNDLEIMRGRQKGQEREREKW